MVLNYIEHYNVKEVKFCVLFCFNFFIIYLFVCVYVHVHVFECAWADTTICIRRSKDNFMSHPCGSRDGVQDIQAFMWAWVKTAPPPLQNKVVTSGLGSQLNSHHSSKGDACPSKLTFRTTLQVRKASGSYPWHLVELWGVKTSHERPRRRTPHWAGGAGQVRDVLTQSSEGSQARRCRCRNANAGKGERKKKNLSQRIVEPA